MSDFIAMMSAIGTIISAVFVFLTYTVYKKTLDTRLYVISEIIDEKEEKYDIRYNLSEKQAFRDLNFEVEGFPHPDFRHNRKKWSLHIKNRGDFPATNVKLKFRINIYNNKIIYGIDQADIKNNYLQRYVFDDQEVTIQYLPPGDSVCVPLIYLDGQFPKATVQVLHFTCNENKFIKSETEVGSYEHPDRYLLGDAPDIRKFIGTAFYKNKHGEKN